MATLAASSTNSSRRDEFEKVGGSSSKIMEFGIYILSTVGLEKLLGSGVKQVTSAYISVSPKPKRKQRRRKSRSNRSAKKPYHRKKWNSEGPSSSSSSKERDGVRDFLHQALRILAEARSCTPQEVISRILFYLADALGESLDQPKQKDLKRAVGAVVREANGNEGSIVELNMPHSLCLDRSITGLIVSYREKSEHRMSRSSLKKLRKSMHFKIPIQPFDATIKIPAAPERDLSTGRTILHSASALILDDKHFERDKEDEENHSASGNGRNEPHRGMAISSKKRELYQNHSIILAARNEHVVVEDTDEEAILEFFEEQDLISRMVASSFASSRIGDLDEESREGSIAPPCTPQSFPPTPASREQLMTEFQEFTQNVLYRARDELRGVRQANDRAKKAIFNPSDAHEEIVLGCGGHSVYVSDTASKGPFFTVRSVLPVQRNFSCCVYFEFYVAKATKCTAQAQTQSRLCLGLGTSRLKHSQLCGTGDTSIGFDSSGYIIKEGRWLKTAPAAGAGQMAFSHHDTVGICVRSQEIAERHCKLRVAFFVNGQKVSTLVGEDEDNDKKDEEEKQESNWNDEFDVLVPKGVKLYPTATLITGDTQLFCHFASDDISNSSSKNSSHWDQVVQFAHQQPLFALEGTPLAL